MKKSEILEKSKELLLEIAKIGKKHIGKLKIKRLFPFVHYFDRRDFLDLKALDKNDGLWSRREILARYLLLRAVLDHGPDSDGLERFVQKIINSLYEKEIRIFHKPLDFFREIGIAIDNILKSHASVKKIRAAIWAKENHANPDKYNLFLDNSKQVLNYAIFRWGVPLALPLLLSNDGLSLVEYIENHSSSEIMSRELKDHNRYGLGKAIGDKAAHLFAKWYVHSFKIAKTKTNAWGNLSFELPLDSNAGRVLFRTGWLLYFTTRKVLQDWEVIQKNKGKGGTHYLRVTNLRGIKTNFFDTNSPLFKNYITICQDYLKTKQRPRSVEIQQIPNVLLLNTKYGIGDLDDGLMYIGTSVCFNLEKPKCSKCPIQKFCLGHKKYPQLIRNYST